MAVTLQSDLLAGGAVGEGHMVIGDIVEEMDFVFVQQKTGGNGMNGRITPSLVKETTVLVEGVEEVDVGLGSQPLEVTHFEVGPL